ncbi:MAG: glycosyltransferase [Phycisphaerales bacterium]
MGRTRLRRPPVSVESVASNGHAPPVAVPGAPSPPPAVSGGPAQPPGLLLEIAWEVCNQVGGIFQVLKSKVPTMVERWGERYCLIGPWEPAKAALEFEETTPTGIIGQAVQALRAEGLHVHHGRWLIAGRPKVLLVEHWQGTERLDATKYRLFADHRISSPTGDSLCDGVVSFADAVRRLIEKICEKAGAGGTGSGAGWSDDSAETNLAPRTGQAGRMGPILAHCHEWMGGLCIPMLRQQNLPVGCIFQTHATLLGRYMASGDDWFYDRLAHGHINDAEEAVKYNIPFQHGVERACAHGAHVFTTVSTITAEECAGLLGRRPDVVLPNGLDIQRYNVGHEFQTLHAEYKEKINRFVMGHFFPSYSFDLDKTLYFFTSGRFEPRNKGFDVSLEAMARLNGELRARGSPVNVVFFIITQRPSRSLHPWALQQRGVLNEFRNVCDQIMREVGEQVFKIGATGQRVKLDDLVSEASVLRYRRIQQAIKVDRLPLVTTHMIEDEGKDPVLAQIRNVWLFNRKDDPVKIVYHPDFINPTNPLWGIDYEQFVRGCHAGIFPSAYEPWGYTPLECMAMGVPAVSSDLAGFGSYIAAKYGDHSRPGAWVVRRRGRSYHDAASELSRYLLDFCRLDRRGRIALRNQVEAQSWEFDWSVLSEAYIEAHDLALHRAFGITATAST